MRSGVPQGTVIGPNLFIIYVNDLSSAVNSQCLMFADEERVTIPNIIDLFTQTVLYFSHRDVVALCESSSKWQLLFNFSKCTLLTIDHLTHPNNYFMELFQFEYVEDLGIKIDSHLKFHQHYSLVISK